VNIAAGNDMLKALGSGVLPPGVERGAIRETNMARAGFADLLAKVRGGAIESGLEVTVANGAGVNLSEKQLEQLAKAADLAESEGATTALVMIDGMALRMDVTGRKVLGTVDLSAGGVVTDIDSMISIPSDSQGEPSIVPPPSRGVLGLSAGMLESLSNRNN
jgi:hypothetical protein